MTGATASVTISLFFSRGAGKSGSIMVHLTSILKGKVDEISEKEIFSFMVEFDYD